MFRPLFASFLFAALLSGCTAPAPDAMPKSHATPGTISTMRYTDNVSAFRAANGLPGVRRSAKLTAIAQAHANDMARMDDMTHYSSDGSDFATRLKRGGYRFRSGRENIAKTVRGQAGAMQIWIDSPAHRDNMLNPRMKEYGLANNGKYWAMVLALPK